MTRILLIDGENFKYKIRSVYKNAGKQKPLWHEYNFKGLFKKVFGDAVFERKVFYFAKITEHAESIEKSKQLIEEQRQIKTHLEKQGFEVTLSGRVRGQKEVDVNGKTVLVFREKGVDVRIAVDMTGIAHKKIADEIFLASSDSDLQPAIKMVKEQGVSCVYVGFETQPKHR